MDDKLAIILPYDSNNYNLNQLNDLYINKDLVIKRLYNFIIIDKSRHELLKFNIENFNKIDTNDENYDLYEASCIYTKKNNNDFKQIVDYFKMINDNQIEKERLNLLNNLIKANSYETNTQLQELNQLSSVLQNRQQQLNQKIKQLKIDNIKLISEVTI